ncbi:LysR substrate-binding domain-containing protein [Aliamphritea spongicola]|uniref:LysR substrate-binding domain-containing protein n=1 Tax=Aliamphritea spongicola TaxID=707589 RepID=UPI00196B0903|nr:LysR substrate-binding domain-containing protein [Aliamphritea spongicola]MBN3562250.1 LysR family transcriptional regulator [Aliamphritea spongicola]
MNVKQIAAFRAVMISGSTVGAAKMLYISQPAVTRLIKDLEDRCGFALFERRSSRLFPTPEAESLYQEVKRHFMGMDQLAQSVEQIRTLRTGRLRIAAMPALAYSVLPRVVSNFMQTREDVSLTLTPGSSVNVAKMVGSQQFDLGIVMLPVDARELTFHRCYRTHCRFICNADHPYADRQEIIAEDLHEQDFVTIGEQNPLTRYRIDAALQAKHIHPRQSIETPMFITVQALVKEGLGVSIIDPFTASIFTESGGKSLNFRPDIPFYFAFITPVNKQISALAEEFIHCFEQLAEGITDMEIISHEDIDLK